MPTVDLPTLSDTELIEQMREARKRAAMATASEVMAVAELARRREAEARAGGASPVQTGEFVTDEISLALTVTGCAAMDLVRIGRMLQERLEATRTAFEAGLIDLPRVKVIVTALIGVAIPIAHQVERAIVGLAPTLTTGQLRHRIRQALIQADPPAARQRTSTALTLRRIESFDNPDGTADLIGRSLPSDRVAAIRDRLTRAARQLRANGDGRPLHAIRADLAMDWLQGTPTGATTTPTGSAETTAILTGPDEPAAALAGNAPRASAPAQAGQAVTTATAEHGTHLVATTPKDRNSAGERPSAEQARSEANTSTDPATPGTMPLEGVGQTPPRDVRTPTTAPPAEVRTPTTAPPRAIRTSATPAVRRDVAVNTADAHSAEDPGQRAREDVMLAVEQIIGKTIADTADQALGRLLADAAPDGLGRLLHEAITRIEQAVEPLRTNWCRVVDPGTHEDGRYRPPARIRRKVGARHPRCAFPTCDKPAESCDLDHTIPWHKHGPTCICNLTPLCRHHHRLKQHPPWRLIQPWPGVTIWTTPANTCHVRNSHEDPLPDTSPSISNGAHDLGIRSTH